MAGNHQSACRDADEGQSDDGRRPRPAASLFGEAPERPKSGDATIANVADPALADLGPGEPCLTSSGRPRKMVALRPLR